MLKIIEVFEYIFGLLSHTHFGFSPVRVFVLFLKIIENVHWLYEVKTFGAFGCQTAFDG